jgi:hypothetical protein
VAAAAVVVVVVMAPLRHLPGMSSILHPVYIMGLTSYS